MPLQSQTVYVKLISCSSTFPGSVFTTATQGAAYFAGCPDCHAQDPIEHPVDRRPDSCLAEQLLGLVECCAGLREGFLQGAKIDPGQRQFTPPNHPDPICEPGS